MEKSWLQQCSGNFGNALTHVVTDQRGSSIECILSTSQVAGYVVMYFTRALSTREMTLLSDFTPESSWAYVPLPAGAARPITTANPSKDLSYVCANRYSINLLS